MRLAGVRVNEGDVQIADMPVEVVDELARILPASGVGPVPEVSVKSEVHGDRSLGIRAWVVGASLVALLFLAGTERFLRTLYTSGVRLLSWQGKGET
jgi:hypothetical protein